MQTAPKKKYIPRSPIQRTWFSLKYNCQERNKRKSNPTLEELEKIDKYLGIRISD
ncbi:MAG: hypothetical protein KatS3mg090_0476 [Patescibacteria group bacterium]|nr:MAG: hypothetical protein KatS3mg090_0476 [Patescibacteria group bacterium]